MPIPIHTANLFQRPKEGNGYIRRLTCLNYTHSIVAQGGFDTCKFDVAVRSQTEGQEFLNNYLGCRVFCYADNPAEPMWEGLINRITFNAGGISYTISLDEMANRVTVVYNAAADVATQSVAANSTTSQAIYGIKQDQIEFGANPSGSTAHPNALRDTILTNRAFPQTSITKGGGDTNTVTLECIGFYQTLTWEKVFTVAGGGTASFNTRINGYITGLSNGTTFFNNADVSGLAANATVTSNQQRAQSIWEVIQKIAEGGDAANYYIVGIEPTNYQTGLRRFYYRQVNAATEYIARTRDGLRIRNLYGREVPPWTVRPDRAILVTDVLVGYNTRLQVDPRLTYIFRIQYDANRQEVQYFGADDTTARGAYMLARGYKPISRPFGAGLRVQVG